MLRIFVLAALACLACKFILGKWPWEYLNPRPTADQAVFRARKLLAVPADARREEIVEAHRRLVAMVHPDKGGTSAQVHEANDARDLLLSRLPDRGASLRSNNEDDTR